MRLLAMFAICMACVMIQFPANAGGDGFQYISAVGFDSYQDTDKAHNLPAMRNTNADRMLKEGEPVSIYIEIKQPTSALINRSKGIESIGGGSSGIHVIRI